MNFFSPQRTCAEHPSPTPPRDLFFLGSIRPGQTIAGEGGAAGAIQKAVWMQNEARGCLQGWIAAHLNQDVTRLTLSYDIPRDRYLVFRTDTGFSSYDLDSRQWQHFPVAVTKSCSTLDLVVCPDAIIELVGEAGSLVHVKVWPLGSSFPSTCLKTRPQAYSEPNESVTHLRFVTREPGTAQPPTLISHRSSGQLHHADARDGRLSTSTLVPAALARPLPAQPPCRSWAPRCTFSAKTHVTNGISIDASGAGHQAGKLCLLSHPRTSSVGTLEPVCTRIIGMFCAATP